jgi:hypothetical protein
MDLSRRRKLASELRGAPAIMPRVRAAFFEPALASVTPNLAARMQAIAP